MLMVSCQVSIVPNRKNDGAQSTTIITHTTKTMPVRCTDVGGEPVEDGEFRRYLGWKYHVRFIRRVLARCLLVPSVHLIVLSPEHLPVPLTIAPGRLSPTSISPPIRSINPGWPWNRQILHYRT